jgi:hypothetical protein
VYLEIIKIIYTYLAIVSLAHLGFHEMITEAKGDVCEELHCATTSFAPRFFKSSCGSQGAKGCTGHSDELLK